MNTIKIKPAINLIIGADGLIGKGLLTDYSNTNELAIGTSRRSDQYEKNRILLDLNSNISDWEISMPVKTAYICAGVTNLEACNSNPNATARVNVSAISELVRKLVKHGAFVIYLSSNQVFDGSGSYYMPEAPFSPVTEYGRQKAETERNIREMGDSVAIVRFTKILGPEYPLFLSWVKTLRAGKPVHPFSDMHMAPVHLSSAISILRLIGDRHISGIVQVSGHCDISYAEAAYIGSEILEIDPDLIQPVKASQSGYSSAVIPNNTTLNIDRIKSVLGVEPPDSRRTIKTVFQSL